MKLAWLVILAVAVVALDQYSKVIISQHFVLGETLEVLPGFFNLTLAHNLGAAFGIFADAPESVRGYLLAVTTIAALAIVFFIMRGEYGQSLQAKLAFSLIIGGAIGNVIDRIRLGYVVDFLDCYWRQYHWPAFNVADSCICIGVMLLLFMPKPEQPQH